jgi:hypothetical protein
MIDFEKGTTPGMLKLTRIIEPNLHREITPSVVFRDLAIRADLIRSIEPAEYGTLWEFKEKPKNWDSSTGWSIGFRWSYWFTKTRRPCLRLTVEDLGTILVEGDFGTLLSDISAEI